MTVTLPGGDTQMLNARYAFDSRLRPGDILQRRRCNYLKQHFLGWEVETANPVFDPQVVTLFDLRTPQREGITFFYTLPFSCTRALVEYTLFPLTYCQMKATSPPCALTSRIWGRATTASWKPSAASSR